MRIICENAINYNTIDQAKQMIKEARDIPNSLSKFQLFGEEQVVNKEHLEYCKKRMLSFEDTKELMEYGRKIGQDVFFTPMAPNYVDWCLKLDVRYFKIRHWDQTNLPIINAILSSKRAFNDVFVSTDYPLIFNRLKFKSLYCVPKYPAEYDDYKNCFYNLDFNGISDHTPDLQLFKKVHESQLQYFVFKSIIFEKHCKLDNVPTIEDKWAIPFSKLKEVARIRFLH